MKLLPHAQQPGFFILIFLVLTIKGRRLNLIHLSLYLIYHKLPLMFSKKRWTWNIVCSPRWMPWWVMMMPINTSSFSSFIMRPMTPLIAWICLLIHFLLHYVQALYKLDVEAILLLFGFHNPIIINFISLDIFLQDIDGLHQVQSLLLALFIPIGFCTIITHADTQPYDFILMVIIPFCIFHSSDICFDPILIYLFLTMQNV